MVKDAILCYIEGLVKHNESIPNDTPSIETQVEITSPVAV